MVRDSREDLKHWAIRNRISLEELKQNVNYVVESGDLQLEKKQMHIMACTVDPYGNPYVPGNSIKGMLRTILLYADILKNPGEYRRNRK